MRLSNEKPHSCPDGRRIHTSPLKAEFSNTAHREFGAPYFLPSGSVRTAQKEKPMNRFAERIRVGLEDAEMLANIDQAQLDAMAQAIMDAKRVYIAGWGRAGNCVKILAMDCSQMGMEAHICGDNTTPSIHEGDILIIGSGSGTTKTMVILAEEAKEHGAKLGLISGNAESTIGKMADYNIEIKRLPKRNGETEDTLSGGTFYHVMLQTVDILRMYICDEKGLTLKDIVYNHNNLE